MLMRQFARGTIRRLGAAWPVVPAIPARAELLLVRPDHLGDVLFLLPALERLRRALPELRISLMVGPWSHPVVARDPHVDEILTFPFPGFTRERPSSPFVPYLVLRRLAAHLRRRAPLAAVILRDDHWWGAWLARAAGIPIRIGADHPAVRPYLTHPVRLTGSHWVERNCEILDATTRLLGGQPPATAVDPQCAPLRWYPWPGAELEARRLLDEAGVGEPYAVIHPGAGAPVKRWPATRWIAVGRQLVAGGLQVVLTGGPDERELVEAIRQGIVEGAVSLAARTTLPVLAEVLRGARLVIGPDAGPLHLAVAVGTPTLHLFGPSQPEHFGPWGDPRKHRALEAGWRCPRCGDLGPERPEGAGCMLAISTEQVLAACQELLDHA
ncbi:glycosyltransferase family 9 protein [Thermomicrobiaceae bacterium CFH 74404]|uniref:Glycosyltransferase family 9 protein n=1 Tax=Thermalbibacter longus TaxID=2951981 RepID=A0AA42BAB9_9BACT|nr:glycosyltransferase family 9 protein [Thermalbibacter longus]MCM8748335.1 glycosyltransferase family 9 protein [Thermalbibacter longus]